MALKSVKNLKRPELTHIVWEQLGIRPGPSVSLQEMHDALQYRETGSGISSNPVNNMREELVAFIDSHRDQLSMPCNGKCYEHCDTIVVSCHAQYMEDNPHNGKQIYEEGPRTSQQVRDQESSV